MDKTFELLMNNLDFTHSSEQFAILKSSLKNAPEKNSNKIENLKQALSSGEYQIKSAHIASKMIDQNVIMPELEEIA